MSLFQRGDFTLHSGGRSKFLINADALTDEDLVEHAEALDLDVERFVAALATGVHIPKVREDFMSGVRSGVNGTPTFYIDGVRHDGGYDAASLLRALDAAARAA